MHILQLSPQFPYPLNHGGAIGIAKLTEAISKFAHVTLVSYPPGDSSLYEEGVRYLTSFCDLKLVSSPLPPRSATLLRTLFHGAYPIERRMMPEMFNLIERLIRENTFDIVHLDHAHMGRYGLWIKQKFDLPVVLREHNFESVIYDRFARNERNPIKKILATIHGRRLRKEELSFIRGLDATSPITKEDEALMRAEAPDAWYETIPAGVDMQYFTPGASQPDPVTIMWVGGMNWEPNKDAVYYFANDIFSFVLSAYPNARFEIIGVGTEELDDLKSKFGESVVLHGRVEDIRPYVQRATVMICPLRVGGGMRLKLLDFFSMGKAVVSTRIGAEGNLAKDGEHIILRDLPKEFAEAIIQLLASPEHSKRLGQNARLLVEQEYSWESIGKRFIAFYKKVIEHHRGNY